MKTTIDSFKNGGSIWQNGVRVGRLEHYPDMTYVMLVLANGSTKFIARIKYLKHGARAKDLARWVFARFTHAELVAMPDCWEGATKPYNEAKRQTPEYWARVAAGRAPFAALPA